MIGSSLTSTIMLQYILLSMPSIFCCDHVHCTRFQKDWAELHEASRECAVKAQVCIFFVVVVRLC